MTVLRFPEYQKALDESGYDHKLEFTAPDSRRKRKPRSRDIMWFNPPFNMSVTTNVGAAFLRLIDKHFKKDNPLSKIINRSTVKVSYSCTKNVKSLIDPHNQKIMQDEKREAPVKPCNCQRHNKPNCPFKGESVFRKMQYTTQK